MNRTSIQFEGVEELRDALRNVIPREAIQILRTVNFNIAAELRDVMKKLVKKRTGKLEHTIYAIRRRSRNYEHISEVRGGREAPYAFMLEFGTSKTRAQPFILPSVEELRPDLERIYREQFGKALERVMRRKAKMPRK